MKFPISKTVCCSAPGKILLFGEHAVVYGHQAVATSLSGARTSCRLSIECYEGSLSQRSAINISLQLCSFAKSITWKNFPISLLLKLKSFSNISNDSSQHHEKCNCEIVEDLSKFESVITDCNLKYACVSEVVDVEPNKQLVHLGKEFTLFPELFSPAAVFLYLISLQLPSLLDIAKFESESYSQHSDCSAYISCRVETSLWMGAGLGSSAAYSVSLSAAVLSLAGECNSCHKKLVENNIRCFSSVQNDSIPLSNSSCFSLSEYQIINRYSLVCEKIFHGTPSGIDNTISTHGGILSFMKSEDGSVSINILPMENCCEVHELKLLVVNTTIPRSTKSVVAQVRKSYGMYKPIFANIFEAIHNISVRCWHLMKDSLLFKDIEVQLEELIRINQSLLQSIGVSNGDCDQLVSLLYKQFGLSAKITGAGKGGCIFALIPTDYSEERLLSVEHALKEQELPYFISNIAGPGIRYE